MVVQIKYERGVDSVQLKSPEAVKQVISRKVEGEQNLIVKLLMVKLLFHNVSNLSVITTDC